MEALVKHIRDGVRRLRKHAGLIAIAIFTSLGGHRRRCGDMRDPTGNAAYWTGTRSISLPSSSLPRRNC